MRLYEELAKSDAFLAFAGARVIFLPLRAAYFEGVKALGDFSQGRVEVCFSTCSIAVEGEDLSIGKYTDGDLCVLGKVRSLSLLEGT
jgi:hypothetical protein